MAEPFDPEDIDKAAKALLSVDRFDTERLGSDEAYDEDSDDDEEDDFREVTGLSKRASRRVPARKRSAEENDEDDEDSDPNEMESHRRRLREELRKQQEKDKGSSKQPSSTGPKSKEEAAELETLLDKMAKLSLNDKNYGLAFVRARQIDPSITAYIQKPILKPPSIAYEHDVPRDVPPHMGRPDVNRFLPRRPPPPPGTGCYGCGTVGHVMNVCPKLQEYLANRQVKRNHRGQITDNAGQVIRRENNETIVQAIERTLPKVNFVMYGTPAEDQEEPQSEEETDVLVYPVERRTKETKIARKQAFDGVQVPRSDKGKSRESGSAPRTSAAQPRVPMQRLIPMETQAETFNPDNDIEMIEDRTQVQRKKVQASEPAAEKTRWTPRASDVSKTVDPGKIAEKLLDLPVTLQVRDIAGASREVASSLIDMLKLKKSPRVLDP
ncbi:hypothetical protein OH77DRAFT_1533267 [Trametes cingulata]|nr:hypothetical protein OH77DRAFT_1533267 [Trametes cingulata]